jgi:hypothetical protein
VHTPRQLGHRGFMPPAWGGAGRELSASSVGIYSKGDYAKYLHVHEYKTALVQKAPSSSLPRHFPARLLTFPILNDPTQYSWMWC